MKLWLTTVFIALFGFAGSSQAQTAFRFDPTPVLTVATGCAPNAQCQALLVPGSTISVCSYPSCLASVPTYTGTSAATACPAFAPVTLPPAYACSQFTGPQGQFGFWVATTPFMYRITLPNRQVFGPYPVYPPTGGGSGSGTVTSVATSGPITGGPITTTGTIDCPTCATTSSGGAITGTAPVSVSSGGAISVANATSGAVGVVRPDNSTITISGGTISAVTGGGGTVTNVATTAPITGGPVTTTGSIACPTCATTAFGGALSGTAPIAISSGGAIALTGIVPAANGGNGVANTATHTLGTANQNWATLGTGIVKNTTTTGAISDAAASDVIGLWSGSCSSSTYLSGSGACTTPSGGGTVTGVTATAPVTSTGGTAPVIAINNATSSTVGVVKPDNSTITISGGTISAAASFAPSVINASSNATANVVCNNSTDDTAAWTALTAIPGATIQSPNNCTSLTTGITPTANGVTIILSPGFILKNTSGTTPVLAINQLNFTITGSGALDGGGLGSATGSTAAVLYLGQFAANFTVSNITVQHGGTATATNVWAGIQAFASSATQSPTGSITNVHVTDMPGLCVGLGGTHDVVIIGGEFDHCYKGGVEFAGTGEGSSITSARIHDVFDLPASGALGAAGNGIFCSGSANCNATNNVIYRTEYSGIRANGSAGSSIIGNAVTNPGDWGIYTEFNNSNTAITGNFVIDPLGGCFNNSNGTFNFFGLGNLNSTISIAGNTCVDPQGSGTDGDAATPIFGVGLSYTSFSTLTGNTVNGAYLGMLGESTAITNSQTPSVLITGNNFFDDRPQTITYSSLSGTVTAGDQIYVGGSSWDTSTKRGLVIFVNTGTTQFVIKSSAGYFAASDAVVDITSSATFTASAVQGPQLARLTLSTQSGFNLFDSVTMGSGATQSAGMVVCVPAATLPGTNSSGCPTANHIVVSLKPNATGLQVPFPSSGTITDTTTSSTATVSAVTVSLLQQQVAIAVTVDNSGFCNQYVNNNQITTFVQFAIAQYNGSIFGTPGSGICYVPIGPLNVTAIGSSGASAYTASTNTLNVPQYTGGGSAQSLFDSSTSTTPSFSGTMVFSMANVSTTSPVVVIPTIMSASTSASFSNLKAGARGSITWQQAASGGPFTVTYTGTVANMCQVSPTASILTTQLWHTDGTTVTGDGCSTNEGVIARGTEIAAPSAPATGDVVYWDSTLHTFCNRNSTTITCLSGTALTPSSLVATGIVDGTAPMTVTTTATATLGGAFSSGYTMNQEATAATAITYTLPTAAAGKQYCVANSYNGSAPTTGTLELLTSASGQFIIYTDGTLSATGGFVQSGGAARDAACVVGIDSTHWMLYPSSGSWTKH